MAAVPDPALPPPDYDTLFGVPVRVIDDLMVARRRSEKGETPLADWRTAAQRAFAPHPELEAARATGDLRSLRTAATRLMLGDPTDAPAWAALDPDAREHAAQQLLDRIRALDPPPTNEDLPRRLDDLEQRRSDYLTDLGPGGAHMYDRRRRILLRWLAETDTNPRDPDSGIPLADIEPYLTDDDAILGEVPVGRRAAVARAWLTATPADRETFARFSDHTYRRETDWKMTEATTAMPAAVLTEFLKHLSASGDPSAQAVMHEWHDGTLREHMRAFLDR